jgi:hypothetical protein
MHDSTIINEAATVANTFGKALWLVDSGTSIQTIIFRKNSTPMAKLASSLVYGSFAFRGNRLFRKRNR